MAWIGILVLLLILTSVKYFGEDQLNFDINKHTKIKTRVCFYP